MNYTKPNNKNYEDKPEDWLYSALTFSQALNIVIPPNKGVCVELKGDALDIHEGVNKVIVHNNGEMMSIEDVTDNDNLQHGDWVEMKRIDDLTLNN